MQTPRLRLVPLAACDARALFDYRSDPEVSRFQSWEPRTLVEVSRFIEDLQSIAFDTPGTWYQCGIRLRDTDLLVGDMGVRFPEDHPHQAEIGITIAPAWQGKGLAAEAVNAMLEHLFTTCDKHRVFASVDPRNLASLALLKRVGMRQEALHLQSLFFKGEWVDDAVFALLQAEWKGR
ncbi:MAG: GNAT family N-acetyltransferase [Ignavibacteria bacterium]|nr:GNAT family N-acetyltransferase [Ignavibacteria bacterium]